MISIITSFYDGNRYIKSYANHLKKAIDQLNCSEFEVIIINDSPSIDIDTKLLKMLPNLRIIKNNHNIGIHKSRIKGYNLSHGEYILFLDQDDYINEDFFVKTISYMQNYDVCVTNGYYEKANTSELIYKNSFTQKQISNMKCMFTYRNLIISPGQCLIKKKSVPSLWIKQSLKVNGADDYMLWLLMLIENKKFAMINEPLYVHTYNGGNLSLNENNMLESIFEMYEIMNAEINNKNLNKMLKSYKFKYQLKNVQSINKILIILKHPICFIKNAIYFLLIKMVRL